MEQSMAGDLSSTTYSFSWRQWLVGAQMVFVAFGALVLVPLLTGLDPNVALFTAGAGTLIFQACTRGRVPVFLASSFAFIAPTIYGVERWGIPGTLCGLAAAGVAYVVLSTLIRIRGSGFLHRWLPGIVTGPVILVIGLSLAPVAVNLASGRSADGATVLLPQGTALLLAAVSLGLTILATLRGRGMVRVVAILIGAAGGFLLAAALHLAGQPVLDLTAVGQAPWLALPDFVLPEWNVPAIVYILPVALVPAIEHFGDILAIGSVTGRDYLEDPGIQNTLLGDGLATLAAGLVGGPPNTTYSEVTGAVTLTRAFNPAVMTWAALWAIAMSMVGKVGATLRAVPGPVMGGVLILLFGAIAVVGLNTLIATREDLLMPRTLIVVAAILVLGIGGMEITVGSFQLAGIGLAGVAGVLLNAVLPENARPDTR